LPSQAAMPASVDGSWYPQGDRAGPLEDADYNARFKRYFGIELI
jgi:hypothetical protein